MIAFRGLGIFDSRLNGRDGRTLDGHGQAKTVRPPSGYGPVQTVPSGP